MLHISLAPHLKGNAFAKHPSTGCVDATASSKAYASPMRTLAIDLGTRRVGLALSDEGGRFASPFDVLTVGSPEQAMVAVLEVIRREDVRRVVVGLPLNMDDSIGPAARQTFVWGRELAARSGVAVVFVDERLTSFAAEQQLIERKRGGEKITRGDRKKQLDALAAATFLQEFLDGKLAAFEANE
jgi:putative Holliday junction resolvase